jgi:hypothetical protein
VKKIHTLQIQNCRYYMFKEMQPPPVESKQLERTGVKKIHTLQIQNCRYYMFKNMPPPPVESKQLERTGVKKIHTLQIQNCRYYMLRNRCYYMCKEEDNYVAREYASHKTKIEDTTETVAHHAVSDTMQTIEGVTLIRDAAPIRDNVPSQSTVPNWTTTERVAVNSRQLLDDNHKPEKETIGKCSYKIPDIRQVRSVQFRERDCVLFPSHAYNETRGRKFPKLTDGSNSDVRDLAGGVTAEAVDKVISVSTPSSNRPQRFASKLKCERSSPKIGPPTAVNSTAVLTAETFA